MVKTVKHIILWRLKSTLTETQKVQVATAAKEHLEALQGKIDGLSDIRVVTEKLPSSTADMMLYSTFVSAEALKAYSVSPRPLCGCRHLCPPVC